jgi:hypothetical protein
MIVSATTPVAGDVLVATSPTTAEWKQNAAYVPTSIVKNAGGVAAGTYADLAAVGGGEYAVAELAATPGFDIEIVFTGVVSFNLMRLHMWYDGSAVHNVEIRVRNYSGGGSWDVLDTINAQADYVSLEYDVNPVNHVSGGGEVKIQFYHTSAGNSSHDLHLDAVILKDIVVGGGAGVTEHGSLTGLLDNDHTQYQLGSGKDVASGYAGLDASSRTTKGVITTDDLIVNLATKGLVLKDAAVTPHYWRVTISTLGALVTTDLGTSAP